MIGFFSIWLAWRIDARSRTESSLSQRIVQEDLARISNINDQVKSSLLTLATRLVDSLDRSHASAVSTIAASHRDLMQGVIQHYAQAQPERPHGVVTADATDHVVATFDQAAKEENLTAKSRKILREKLRSSLEKTITTASPQMIEDIRRFFEERSNEDVSLESILSALDVKYGPSAAQVLRQAREGGLIEDYDDPRRGTMLRIKIR